jgi:hypothetical protein
VHTNAVGLPAALKAGGADVFPGGEIGSAVATAGVPGDPFAVTLVKRPGQATRRGCEEREKKGLEKVAADKRAADERTANERRAGPVEGLQNDDCAARIKEIYAEMPERWLAFRRPELHALLTEMFARHRELHLHGTRLREGTVEQTIQTLVQNALVKVAATIGGDGGSPPFKAAVRAASAALLVQRTAATTQLGGGTVEEPTPQTLSTSLRVAVVGGVVPWLNFETAALLSDVAIIVANVAVGLVLLILPVALALHAAAYVSLLATTVVGALRPVLLACILSAIRRLGDRRTAAAAQPGNHDEPWATVQRCDLLPCRCVAA